MTMKSKWDFPRDEDEDHASIQALLKWARDHDVTHHVMMAAAGIRLTDNVLSADELKNELDFAQKIFTDFAMEAQAHRREAAG
jgi:hypothetical protein